MSDSPLHTFVDEAGDTTLFGRHGNVQIGEVGSSRYFIVGRLDLDDPPRLAHDLDRLRAELLADPLLRGVPSMQPERQRTALFFHAKDDLPEIRFQVFRLLLRHGVRFSAVVKDKSALLAQVRVREVQETGYRYKADGHDIYDTMMRALFSRPGRFGLTRHITFGIRGNKPRTHVLEAALVEVEQAFERDFGLVAYSGTTIVSTYPWKSAGLQACDYFLWALQRFYERGEERFLTAMWPHIVEVIDLDQPAPKVRGKHQRSGTVFNEKHPLNLANRAGVWNKDREI